MICLDCGGRLECEEEDGVTWVTPCAHCIKEAVNEAKHEAYHRGYEDGKLAQNTQRK